MSKQPIKYATTTIDPAKSASEIGALVQKYGGSRFEMRWGAFGSLTGIRFAIRAEGIGEVPVRLEAQTERIEEILTKAKRAGRSYWRPTAADIQKVSEQAHRIAWRQLRDFVEQALLAMETGLFNIGAAFMAHIEVQDDAQGDRVTMSEFLLRRATMHSDGDAIRIMPASEAPRLHQLPPARDVGA
jgi:hypothetical protein